MSIKVTTASSLEILRNNKRWEKLDRIDYNRIFSNSEKGFYVDKALELKLDDNNDTSIRLSFMEYDERKNEVLGYKIIEFYKWTLYNHSVIELANGSSSYDLTKNEYEESLID